jgi:hypothetical protein
MTTCQCPKPAITWGGPDKATPFCRGCLLRIETKPAYEPDPDRKFWKKKDDHGTA